MIGAGLNIGISAVAKRNETDTVHIEFEGFGKISVDIDDTEMKEEEKGTPAALVRGICNCFIESGNIFGGFDAKIVSEIPKEGGIDYLPVFEITVGSIINELYFGNTVPRSVLAGFGKKAENEFYGRYSEITEQIICTAGETVFADFEDPFNISCKSLNFNFSSCGYKMILVDLGIGNTDFDADRKIIIKNMKLAAMEMGYERLSEAAEVELYALSPLIRQKYGERILKTAMYYYDETRRVKAETEALEKEDFKEFLELYGNSGESIEENLQNFISEKETAELMKKYIASVKKVLGENGKLRMNRNGFCGMLQVFIKEDYSADFANEMSKEGFKCFSVEIL